MRFSDLPALFRANWRTLVQRKSYVGSGWRKCLSKNRLLLYDAHTCLKVYARMEYCVPETSWPVRRFCRQYLQAEPALDFPSGSLLRQHDVQEHLYGQLFSPDARGAEHQLPPAYVLRVLKALVAKAEESIDDWDQHGVSDNLMLCLANFKTGGSLAPTSLTDAVRKHRVVYYVSSLERIGPETAQPTVTLLENRTTIAASGTTGIRTWEAALHLGEYLCQNRGLVEDRRVLELGAGTGYVSILCAKHLKAASCLATDGSSEVVNSMQANLHMNGLDGDSIVVPLELAWGTPLPHRSQHADQDFDTILGADITFDERDMPNLLATIRLCLSSNSTATVLISATERNKRTFETFIRLAEETFEVVMVAFSVPQKEDQTGPFYSDAVPIHICQLHLRA